MADMGLALLLIMVLLGLPTGQVALAAFPPSDFIPGPPESDTHPSSAFVLRKEAIKPSENGPGGTLSPAHGTQFPLLENHGISLTVLDIKPCGLSPPHVHPRGTELQYVISGTMLLGFLDTREKYWFNILTAGDVGVVPRGLVHFTQSIDDQGFKSVASFPSEEAGTLFVYDALLNLADTTLRGTTGRDQTFVNKMRQVRGTGRTRPYVDPVCLDAIMKGLPFNYTTGAFNTIY